jgi:2-keto-3-deoxy-6-phosphogluconate aldolase
VDLDMLDEKLRNLSVIEATGAALIARVDQAEKAYQVCRAAVEGGIRAVERR